MGLRLPVETPLGPPLEREMGPPLGRVVDHPVVRDEFTTLAYMY